MTVITLEQVRAWHPCPDYTDERLAELAAGRESITPLEALDLPIPAKDRVWLLTRPGVLPDEVLWAWANACGVRAGGHALLDGTDCGRLAGVGVVAEVVLDDVANAAAEDAWACTESYEAEYLAERQERERQIADLRAILAAQGKETDRDDNNP